MSSELEILRAYIKGATDFPAGMEKGERLQGYEAALQGVLDVINTIERAKKTSDASWEVDRLRAEGAYDTGRDGWA